MVAQMERQFIKERQKAGIEAARQLAQLQGAKAVPAVMR
jgi:DNA invertase Pin-like site-specific DNA recombinase